MSINLDFLLLAERLKEEARSNESDERSQGILYGAEKISDLVDKNTKDMSQQERQEQEKDLHLFIQSCCMDLWEMLDDKELVRRECRILLSMVEKIENEELKTRTIKELKRLDNAM